MTAAQKSEVRNQRSEIVFIHGAGSNREFWHEQRVAFPDAHYLNLPGHIVGSRVRDAHVGAHGRVPLHEHPSPYTIEEYADWIAQYVEDLGLESVVLNGHSMGGAITLELALRRPQWLHTIILTCTGARLRVLPRSLQLLRTDYPAAVDFIVEHSFAHAPGTLTYGQRARITGTRRQMLRTPQQVTLQDYEACDRFDVTARLSEIHLPALCIVGAQDMMTPPLYSHYLHEKIETSHLRIIEGAGHMLPIEQPGAYNEALADFIGHDT